MFCSETGKLSYSSVTKINGINSDTLSIDDSKKCREPSFSDYCALPYNIRSYFEYCEGFNCSKIQNKPNLIYFSGYRSRDSRIFEDEVLTNKKIRQILKNKYILTTLTIDSKMLLPDNYRIVTEFGDTLKIHGEKNLFFLKSKFQRLKIPVFYIIDSNEKLLLEPYYFDESPASFQKYLNQGISMYQKK